MKKILFLISFISSSIFAIAQHTGYTAVADYNKFKESFATASKSITSIKSNFVQEKTLSMLSDKIISKGKFMFQKESKVRMEYTTPFQYLMILNKDKVYVKDGAKETKISTKSNKMFQQINQIMIDCMQGTALNNTNFTTKVFETKTTYLLELTPASKIMKDLFKTVNIVLDKKDFSSNSIEMLENSGDKTILKFSNKELNASIPSTNFDIK